MIYGSQLGALGRDPCEPAPAWCVLGGGLTNFFEACQPIDPRACQESEFGPAMTPENRAAALRKGDELEAAYLRMNPEMAAAWQDWLDTKWVYQMNPAAAPQWASDLGLYVALSAAVFGVLLLLKR